MIDDQQPLSTVIDVSFAIYLSNATLDDSFLLAVVGEHIFIAHKGSKEKDEKCKNQLTTVSSVGDESVHGRFVQLHLVRYRSVGGSGIATR